MISNKENEREIIDYFTNKINFILEKENCWSGGMIKVYLKRKKKVGIEIKELEEAKKTEETFWVLEKLEPFMRPSMIVLYV